MSRLIWSVVLVSLSATAADRSAELRAVVEAERAFAARAQVVDARQAFAEAFAPDAILFSPYAKPAFPELNEPVEWKTNIQWRPVAAAISGAGDMGYTTGPAEYRKTPADAAHAWTYYTSVWGRQPDGTYKVLIDIGIPTPEPKWRVPDWTPPGEAPEARPVLSKYRLRWAHDGLRRMDMGLGQIAQRDLVGAFSVVLAPEGRVHRPGHVPGVGIDAALAVLRKVEGRMGWSKPEGVRVAESGDFGFTYGRGRYEGASGPRSAGDFNYLNIWQLREGRWYLLVHVSHPVRQPPKKS